MMPVPTHLRECVHPSSPALDEEPLEATIRCSCGSTKFALLFPGQTDEHEGAQIPCTAEIDGNYFFLIAALCTSCGKQHLLLDADFHGWNGFVCHDPEQASLPRPALSAWKCLSCAGTEHEATIQIQTEGKEDFVDQTDGEFDAARWPDGFGWFSMAITCTTCSKETRDWVSYETM